MDVRIEVVAVEVTVHSEVLDPTVVTTAVSRRVVALASAVTTSIHRSLISFGRTSLSAVAPDHIRIGGTAVA